MIRYPLSRADSFGAVKNDLLNRKSEISNFFDEAELKKYETVITPFSNIKNAIYTDDHDISRYGPSLSLKLSKTIAVVGAFEYLSDVRPLGRRLRNSLLDGSKVDVFFGYEGGHYSWSQSALTAFFQAIGIEIEKCIAIEGGIKKMILACSQSSYQNFLVQQKYPLPKFSHLIVTTEHSGYRVTGGIGSYVKECDNLYGDDVAIVIIDSNNTLDYDKLSQNKWLAPQLFLGEQRIQEILDSNYDTIGDIVQETIECVLVLYSQIESIESQEMLLNRTILAKKIDMIPTSVRLMTVCHGSSLHLAKAKRSVLDAENIHVAYREKYTIENSDTVILPTDYLRRSYIDSGIANLPDKSRIIKRLPFDLSRIPEGEQLSKYKRLLYIGKTSTIKGFDLFLQTLLELDKNYPEIHDQIEEVVVMATSSEIAETYLKTLYEKVSKIYNITIVSLEREVLLKTLAEYSSSTLALITYRGDNHPLTVLELMAVGLDFIAADAAGTPELILPGYESHNLAPATKDAYSATVFKTLSIPAIRAKKVIELRTKYRLQQEQINSSYSLEAIRKLPQNRLTSRQSKMPTVNIRIEGESKSKEFRNTLLSIEAQTYPHISVNENTEVNSYTMRVYAGDILYSNAVADMVMLSLEDGVGAVLADIVVMSYEGDGRKKGYEEFHPYPPQLGSIFLQEKYNRRVVGLFTERVLDNTFTDWQQCVSLASTGRKISIVPKLSMKLADIPSYFTDDPVGLSAKWSQAFSILPVFDATILYSELRRFDDIYWGLKRVGHLEQYFIPKVQENMVISPKIIRTIGAYERFTPAIIKNIISILAGATFVLLRNIKYFIKG